MADADAYQDLLAALDTDDGNTLYRPEAVATDVGGEDYWVGAPSVEAYDGETYLAFRERTPQERGRALNIHREMADGYQPVTTITADALDAVSVERPALVTDPETSQLRLYLPVDDGERWTIQQLAPVTDPAQFDPATAATVLEPEPVTDTRPTVKDPVVVTDDGFHLFYAVHDGVSEQAAYAYSPDGDRYTAPDQNVVLPRNGWHDHHTRISAVVPVDDGWLFTYDGAGTADYGKTWNLRTGLGHAADLGDELTDCSPDAPVLQAPTVSKETGLSTFGTFRYVDIHDDQLYVEVARDDGAFTLQQFDLPTDHLST